MAGEFFGKYRAIVQNTNDPENRGRITVTCPAVFGSGVSGWCEPCLPIGEYNVPMVGTPVWIEFQQNDLKKAIWSGTWQCVMSSGSKVISYGGATITLSGGIVYLNDIDVLKEIRVLKKRVDALEAKLNAHIGG